MPICTECHTRYIVQTYMDPAEPCECGACKKPRLEDYEPTEDELEERRAHLDGLTRSRT